jgi:2-polyprenyl-3-methyl-5-hydroxy-6-metoxy-1,4-benzoquinol methylase
MDLVESKSIISEINRRHPWELARLKVISSLINKKLPFQSGGGGILVFDIGCGDTFLAEQLAINRPDFDIAAIDIEFTDEMITAYQEKYLKLGRRIQLYRTIDEAEQHYNTKADLILLLDVIEHIENDRQFLQNLASGRFIHERTVFIITVPAFQFLFCSHDSFLLHYRRYSMSTLANMLASSGLELSNKGYFFSSLIVFRVFQVVKEWFGRPDSYPGVGDWKGNKLVSKLVYSLLLTDYFITTQLKKLKILIPGLSIYTICKKPA